MSGGSGELVDDPSAGLWSRRDWRRLGMLAALVVSLHLVGFGLLLFVVVPQHFRLGEGGVFGIGLGISAYTLGLRHALDADHIAVIDNTTRKLIDDGQRPLGVGFFFSLGHSTVVFALGCLVVLGVQGISGAVASDGSALHQATGLVGPVVSGSFLLLIGVLNAVVLLRIVGAARRSPQDAPEAPASDVHRSPAGPLMRVFGRATRAVTTSWHMYPLGCLFGLGFDTATEVALLVMAGGAASSGLPFYAILCLPILFAAGMSLLDTADGAFMNAAYRWAFTRPRRRVHYNIAITGLSVAVALSVGIVELTSVASGALGLTGGLWDAAAGLDLNVVGCIVVALFVALWTAAVVWRRAERVRAPAS